MRDGTVSTSGVIAGVMWAGVVLLGIAGFAAALAGHWHAAVLIGLLDGILAPAAAVAHMRCYVIRIAALVRNLHGLDVDLDTERVKVR